MNSAISKGDEGILTRIGANDPNYNLRRDPGLIHRRTAGNTLFASLYEIHGRYNYSDEIPINAFTSIADLEVLHESAEYVAIQFQLKSGETYQFVFSLKDDNESKNHSIDTSLGQLTWTGVYNLKKNK